MKTFIFICLCLLLSNGALAAKPRVGENCGKASWYHEGTKTANGERFKPNGLTAAHRTLPYGTILNVKAGSRSVHVRINDRGPAKWTGKIIDLSKGAFSRLSDLGRGVVNVCWEIVK